MVKTCQVWHCFGVPKYYNPRSGFKYCQMHYDKLGGKIVYETDRKTGAISDSQRLLKIKRVL